jgi:cytochrome b561
MILVLGHAAMALYHQYIVKDGLLLKMLRPR